jgi:hypothetical protein
MPRLVQLWLDRRNIRLAMALFSSRFAARLHPPPRPATDGLGTARLLSFWPLLPLGLLFDLALLAEEAGDEVMFRRLMRRAVRKAMRYGASDRLARRQFATLVNFHLGCCDFAEAERLFALGGPDAPAFAAHLAAIRQDTNGSEAVIAAARRSLARRLAGPLAAPGAVTLFLPAAAFRREATDYPGFRADIRFAMLEAARALAEAGHAVDVRLRFRTHGVPPPTGGRYVAYHTIDPAPGGVHIKETDRRSFFSVDANGYSGWSHFSKTSPQWLGLDTADASEAARFVAAERQRGAAGKYGQNTAPAPEPGYVFLPLQIVSDSVHQLADMHMFDMLEDVAAACRRRGLRLVAKRHPLCRAPSVALALKRGSRRGLFAVSDAATPALVAGAAAVCVVNSSVGMEALVAGRPVYSFGASEYRAATRAVTRRGEFDAVFEPGTPTAPPDLVEKLIYLLRTRYAVDLTDRTQAAAAIRNRLGALIAPARRT